MELLYRWQCQQYSDDIDENKIISIEKMAIPHQMHSPLLGSNAICGTAAAAFVDVTAVAIAVVAAGAAVSPDAICGTAAAWFHVVDYAC